MEVWKDVVWYEWLYQVSNIGRVKRIIRSELIMKSCSSNWYSIVNLSKDKKKKIIKIHRLVAQAFLLNPSNKPQVNHINWVRNDNRVENLEWVTNSENLKHMYDVLNYVCHCNTKIAQFTIEWVFIRYWNSIKHASETLWISKSWISKNLRWKQRVSKWFIWKYA